MTLLIVYLFSALFISFLCSIMESVLLSTPISYLKVKENEGKKGAAKLIARKQNIDIPLSAILSLNTVAHTVGAAGVGAQATMLWGDEYFGVISAILTILILVLTEIIPKTIGASYTKELSLISGVIIEIMIIVTYPLVYLSVKLTKLLAKKNIDAVTSREEISALVNMGAEEGVFGEKENKIIQNLIRLKSIKVTEIMTPRVVLTTAEEDMLLVDFLRNKDYLYFSRIPVYSGKNEAVTGYVFRQAVFEKLAEDQVELRLRDIKRDIIVVHDNSAVFSVWELMLKKKEHICLIVDEYGGIDGILTMEDIIEALLGFEIVDEKDKVSDMQQFARERWRARKAKYSLLDDVEK